ncbi:hypothetical protein MHM84_03740 [Halomonas sp. McH1-25]|uniref:phage tail assembly chaperone n=1 Tax=unclassified Halomonas TaxID=2609666 RepID=UPI001EF46E81|nr:MULTISPECIES: hypothetical protein [unclassified Halomonas]MCG7598885.1 hypothetical protein [Halomonas sp. McH1-25]MCP1340848.1 hypothetical protein [Halomonas sp. FL8]MCP1361269.1 hypothetical protein [Halomonas sp. BBD45]MCP1363751.1 hypothetical protein [Halomonas sp. BBD48]
MQWADKIDFLLAIEEQRGYAPQALLDRPELDLTERWYMQAFSALSPSRQSGMGVGGIPVSEIKAYAEFVDIVTEPDEFLAVIRAMDAVWLEEQAKRK